METVFDHPAHRDSEDFAYEADVAARHNQTLKSQLLYQKAAKAELEAAEAAADVNGKGILAVSAVNLLLKAKLTHDAKALACKFIEGNLIGAYEAQQLQVIVDKID